MTPTQAGIVRALTLPSRVRAAALFLLLSCNATDALVGSMNPHGAHSGGTGSGAQGGSFGATAGSGGDFAAIGGAVGTAGSSAPMTAGGVSSGGASGGDLSSGGAAGESGNSGDASLAGAPPGPSGGSSAAQGGASAGSATMSGSSGGGSSNLGGTAGTSTAGTSSGAGGAVALQACAASDLTLQGCLVDGNGEIVKSPLSAAVSVSSVGPGDGAQAQCDTRLTTALKLRADDSREWTYFVRLPGRPDDQVQAGDQLDLSLNVIQPNFFDQRVVLGQGNELVLFTTVTWHRVLPDLAAYGIAITYGDPSCASMLIGLCPGAQSPLLVSRGTESSRIDPGTTGAVGDLSVSIQSTFQNGGSLPCQSADPPDSYRYGGFRPRQ